MLAEQVEDSRDDRILRGFGLADLDMGSFRAYRQVFANREPGHPGTKRTTRAGSSIGGWRRDRETSRRPA